MDAYWIEWLNLIIRWIHITVGIAWIGASFYFNWLEQTLDRRQPKSGIAGELWAVHGGGFYHLVKYDVAPAELPERLHWFKWEAYSTWLSGVLLLSLVYYLNADVYLLKNNQDLLSSTGALYLGIGLLIIGWFAYDALCKTALVDKGLLFATLLLVVFALVSWGLDMVFNGRAAYIHVGALIGTLMVGNVFRVIIPAQKAMVAAMKNGSLPDGKLGQAAMRRSLHNNYLTLPVLFIMVSNHYPSTFGHEYNWLILLLLSLISIYVRHFFNLKNQGKRYYWMWLLAALAILGLAMASQPQAIKSSTIVSDAEAFVLVKKHCTVCHAEKPTQPGFVAAPNGLLLETPQQVLQRLADIKQRAVLTESMPLGNMSAMSNEERLMLGGWIESKQ